MDATRTSRVRSYFDHTMPEVATLLPVSRAEWLGARAALAGRRIGRFALGAVATFLVVLLVLLVIPQLGISVTQQMPAPATGAVDTIPLLRAVADAQARAARAESLHSRALLSTTEASAGRSRVPASQLTAHDSLQALSAELDSLLKRSANAPLPASYAALANARALQGESRAATLADSLAALGKGRADLGPAGGRGQSFADFTAQMNDVGLAIRDVAERRRAVLARNIAALQTSTDTADVIDTAGARAARDGARASATAVAARLAAARIRNAARERTQAAARDRANRRVPPVAMLGAATVLAVIIGFLVSLLTELGKPTIANVREAEGVAHCPVIAVVRDDPRSRLEEGIDPFRMLYLGLTATGVRIAAVVISGIERAVVATVAGRLALAAAGDASATLVVDADAEGSPVAGYYRRRPEPGLTDVAAGVRLWREVAQPVGVSEGLAIDMVPGGSLRREGSDASTRDASRADFARFRGEYDFCIVVASSEAAVSRLGGLLERPLVLLCAVVGRTTVASLAASTRRLRDAGASLHAVVLWDVDLPYIPHRSELMTKAPIHR
jgi:Mrp family chromosome partitioning ATPase